MHGLSKHVRTLLWIVFALWLLLMVWLSSEDGQATARTSRWLAATVLRVFGLPQSQLNPVDRTLRMLFHFAGFFVLSGLLYTASRPTLSSGRLLLALVVGSCSIVAVLDEVKKVFISGRHLSWPEAGLNILGVCCGAIVAQTIDRLAARQSQKRKKANT